MVSKQFNIFRRDRENTTGDGVFIAVSSDFVCSRECELKTDGEILWVKICLVGCKNLYVCAYFNPYKGNEISLANFEQSVLQVSNCNLQTNVLLKEEMVFCTQHQ